MTSVPFTTLFQQQRQCLLRTVQRMVGSRSTAEDLLQDTYLRVARALAQGPVEHLEPFLYQTARNLARDHLRGCKRRERTLVDGIADEVLLNIAQPASSPERATHAERTLRRLSHSLAGLTARQQRIFVLNRLHDCSYQEIAGQLQVSPSTVQKELKLISALCACIAQRLEA
ncbi:sigma-70 family RNA polymerase sigma factor [Pseudomonas sp. HR96]|uniref:RNA polymerase sigma factor n=1 Tax=Pseudomonas sp. HR96 TaxID=1027966 RepID=UPI002A756EA2|nr:sigma-70 family RNA polymerase sigma factor [Pseudomonas sp. HR96]WPO99264.1 sigma-70 family RNA polymerase sigma factor [Pseudomonas sp. HR96]